jgi:hypothetical protein
MTQKPVSQLNWWSNTEISQLFNHKARRRKCCLHTKTWTKRFQSSWRPCQSLSSQRNTISLRNKSKLDFWRILNPKYCLKYLFRNYNSSMNTEWNHSNRQWILNPNSLNPVDIKELFPIARVWSYLFLDPRQRRIQDTLPTTKVWKTLFIHLEFRLSKYPTTAKNLSNRFLKSTSLLWGRTIF